MLNSAKQMLMNRLKIIVILTITLFTYTACKDTITNGGITSCDFAAFTGVADSCIVAVPNIFTPNGDGINDVFVVIFSNAGTSPVEDIHIVVQNEAATTVAEGFNELFSWDGSVGGAVNNGLYNVTVSLTIDAVPYDYESYVYCVPYNTVELTPIDCSDCRFLTQWDGANFNSGIDNAEVICE